MKTPRLVAAVLAFPVLFACAFAAASDEPEPASSQEPAPLDAGVKQGLDAASEYRKAADARAQADAGLESEAMRELKRDKGQDDVSIEVCAEKLSGDDSFKRKVSEMSAAVENEGREQEGRDRAICKCATGAGLKNCIASCKACRSLIAVSPHPSALSVDQNGRKRQTWYAAYTTTNSGKDAFFACKVDLEWHFERESFKDRAASPIPKAAWGGRSPDDSLCTDANSKAGYCVASFSDDRVDCAETVKP